MTNKWNNAIETQTKGEKKGKKNQESADSLLYMKRKLITLSIENYNI